MPTPYEHPLPSSRVPDEIWYPRTFDGCIAAGIVLCVSSTDDKVPRLVSLAEDAPGCRQPWPAMPEPDFSRAALLDVWPPGSALWWFSIDGSDAMSKVLGAEHHFDEGQHIRNWTRPSLARLVAETFEHRMHLIGLVKAFEPWLKLADKFATMGDIGVADSCGLPEDLIHHAILFRQGKPDTAEHIARSIGLGVAVEDLAYAPYVREAAFGYRDGLPSVSLGGRGPSIPTTHKVPLTRENLWFLYRFLDLIKAEIEGITGWSRGQIDYGIRKWDLSNWSSAAVDTRWAIKERVAKAHGIPMTMGNIGKVDELSDAEMKRIRELVLSGAFSWVSADGASDDLRPAGLLAAIEKPEKAA